MPRTTIAIFDLLDRARKTGTTCANAGTTPGVYANGAMIRALTPYGRPSCPNRSGEYRMLHLWEGKDDRAKRITLRGASSLEGIEGPAIAWDEPDPE